MNIVYTAHNIESRKNHFGTDDITTLCGIHKRYAYLLWNGMPIEIDVKEYISHDADGYLCKNCIKAVSRLEI